MEFKLERRQAARQMVGRQTRCECFARGMVDFRGATLLDLSRTGVGLRVDVPLRCGQVVWVQLHDRSGRAFCLRRARVIHVRLEPSGGCTVGAAFHQELDADQVQRLLARVAWRPALAGGWGPVRFGGRLNFRAKRPAPPHLYVRGICSEGRHHRRLSWPFQRASSALPRTRAAVPVFARLTEPRRRDSAGMDMEQLQGTWKTVSDEHQGRPLPPERVKGSGLRVTFRGNEVRLLQGDTAVAEGYFLLDPGAQPKAINLTVRTSAGGFLTLRGIYELTGDTLRICTAPAPAQPRPREFKTRPGVDQELSICQRERS